MNQPANQISKTISIDSPTYIPPLKRFLSYQGELDDLLLPIVAKKRSEEGEEEKKDNLETKSGDVNPLLFNSYIDNDGIPVTLYNTPEKYFDNCSKTLLNELNDLKLLSIEKLKETSSYYKDIMK